MALSPPSSRSSLQPPARIDAAGAIDGALLTILAGAGQTLNIVEMTDAAGSGLYIRETGGVELDVSGAGVSPLFLDGNGGGFLTLLRRTTDPPDPSASQAQLYVIDLGATQFLRCRYNDGGVVKSGDVALA